MAVCPRSFGRKCYRGELQIQICQSSQRLRVPVLGCGLQPRLELSPAELELGPLLPQSHGEEGTVVVDVVHPPGKVVKLGNICIGQTGSLVSLDQDQLSFGAVVRQSYTCRRVVMRNAGNTGVRFLVVIDMLKPENLESSSVLQGCSYIDVTFLNETTGEYLFHMVTFKVMASGPIGTVEMSTAVRQRVSSTVKVDNPLPVPVTFAINCKVPDGPFLIPAGGTTSISFRNVFPRATAFQYAVKHPAFSVRAPEMLRAKSSTTITVSFTGGPAPVTSSPFSVDPSIGTLGIGEAMEVTVEFHPPKTGVYTSPMIVHYDTGTICAKGHLDIQKCYRGELQIQICQSSQRLRVPVLGCGLQPRLELSPAELELGPLLPQSHGEEGTVVVDVVHPPGKVVKLGNICIGQTGSLVSLDQDQLSFGAVVRQSYTCRRVVMRNAGNTGLSQAVQYEGLRCFIPGSEALRLTLSGSCVEAPGTRETVTFSCNVREKQSQTILLSNPSSEAWTLKPIVEGKYWKGPEFIHLEARFLVVIDMLKPENLESSSVLQGCSYIDVTFLNETTGEYLFHMVTFKVMASGPIGTVEMSTAVRQRVSSTVKVDNPLPVPVTFAINCKGPFLIPAGGTTSISFRNVFPRATAFQYAVKHPAFSVRAPEMLRAKSSTTITVSFTGGPAPVTSSPFSVDPSIGTLGVGEAMEVTVEFHPPKTGVYTSPMIVHYDTGPGDEDDTTLGASPACRRPWKCYRGELQIQICQSSQRLRVPVLGCGLQPRLELSPAELELGPLLPQSHGEEGTVVGSLVSLDQDQLSFGAVVRQSYTCRRVVMRNAGNTGLSQAVQYEGLRCFIPGSEALRLTLSGSCVEAPGTRETLTFSCNVREKQSQTILLSNPSSEAWTLKPIVEGKYWKGPEFIHLEARFLVVIDMLKPENLESSSVLQGCSYIDVTFLNETTGEYLFHMVTFKVMASGPIGTVEMSTAVRQRVSSTVKVDNPLPVPVTFAINCKVPDGPFLIPAGGTTSISFRNVFPRATAFQYAVKHPAFSVRAPEMLRAKSSTTITVSFTGGPAPVTSRLLVREAEESLTTRQRLASPREMRRPQATQLRDMGEVSHQKFSAVGLEQRLFQPFPSEVVFENYVPRQFYIAALALRNIDRVPRLLNVILGNSPYFELISPSNEDYKVAPGMSSTYRILFRPDEDKDYFDELIIITEREKFFVPIRAIGARASLDFPEQLNFSECPVRFSTQKTLLVRNVGKREACYSITTLSPFSVDPSIGTLGVGEAMEVTVEFHPPKTGVYTSPMIVHYDTGEDVHKSLCGTAVNVNIRLDKSSLTVEKTSVTLSKLSSLVIHNQSAITAHFQWKRFVDQEEEEREGDVLPNSSLEISVIFQPKEARVYQETVYCDISGCETRLPLCISGEGVGPQVQLSCDQLSIGEVTVGSSHSYRVFLLNRGVTETPFSVVSPERALGSCFTFGPREGMLLPFDHQAIWISFNASVVGQFTEEFQFNVKGSPEPLTLTVTGPAFHFNVSSLRFGEVSFGFPRTLCCRLTNTSSVPFNFNLRIPGDGSGAPSVTSFAQVSDSTGPSWRKRAPGAKKPAEFTIRPCTGTICAKGHLDIQVTLCSNTVKRYKLALVVDVDGVGREVLSLPVRARCENKDAAAVWYSSPEPRGIIQPHSSVEIPFTLEVQVTGKQDTVAHVAVFGSKESPLEIHLLSTGEGPVVHVHPSEINFGSIQVLQDASRTLHLSNQSVIPASFSAKMAGADSCWTVGPSQGVIPAKAEVSLAVTANLDDTEQFKDEVVLFIENSRAYVIPVQAVGVGTTIVIDKPFGPELNLAPCFSSLDPCCYRFKMTNKGRRTHLLYWTTEGGTTLKQRKRLPRISKSKGKVSSCGPVLKLQPLRTELMPGQTAEVVLKGSCSTPQVVKEKLLCHAIVGKEGVKNLIVQVDVTCEFIAPALQISSREITFRVEKHPGDVLAVMYKPLSVKNMCSLPLSVVLALEQPFSICTADQQPLPADAQPMKLRTGEELQLCIGFNPAYEEDLLIRAAEKALKIKFLEHPHEEQVTVRGEVYFPNLQIQTTAVDFGCILNDTKDVRYMEMTNCSPLVVQYHWAFLKDSQVNPVRFMETEPLALGVEEVFDILPLHGELQPGQSQRVCFSFFGHANTVSQVTALCGVEGGPSYEVALRGEASRISYLLDTTEIDCGLQVFNKVTEAAVTLQNSGKLGFAFAVLSPGTGTAASPLPGVPLVVPSRGYVEPGKQQVLKVYYLPGVPGVFCRAFQIQLGHLEPEKISLKGEGTFPRIHLDLPRNIKGNAKYEKILLKAKEKLDKGSQREEAIALGEAVAAEPRVDDSGTVWDAQLQMQMEEMLIEEHALEQQKALASRPPEDTAFHQRVHRRLLKAELPEYVLDLGYVFPGDIHTHMVRGGPTFQVHLRAIVAEPSLCLSRDRLEFSSVQCGQWQEGTIQLHNTSQVPCKWSMSMNEAVKEVDKHLPASEHDKLWEEMRPAPCGFEVLPSGGTLAPGQQCHVQVRFSPTEEKCYRGELQIQICQSSQRLRVPVLGCGLQPRLELSPAELELGPLLPQSHGEEGTVVVDVVHPPGKVVKLGNICIGQTVTFSPKRRMQPFSGEVLLECRGLVRSLFAVRGSCQGSLVSLDQDQLSFGAVVRQSYTCRRVVMRNAGNTGVRFLWDVESFQPDFSISPTKGYIRPGVDVPFVVTFRPSKLSQAVQYEGLRCFIPGSEALRLTLSGSTLTFSCNVREKQSQTILLSNPSSEAWTLKPIVEGKYWKGPEFIHLEARQKEKAYQGSIFFPLPDGTGLRYQLEGTAEAPRCSGAISWQVPCRNSHTELIPVYNWLQRPQRFLVVIDMLKPENLESSSVLQGCSYIDVPSSAKKDYQLTFFSYKEGVYRAKVTFLNETTGEYLFHMVTFKVMASGPIGTIEMSTAVRQRVSSTVKVDNPLPVPVTFAINCKVPDGPFLIPAGGTTSISFRNVFPRATAFQYAVKHPAFSVRAPEMLRAKSSTTITVSFTGGPAPVTSRLATSATWPVARPPGP
ncbi:hydrocephalus-inducing protein-like [Lathamus discolor]|uniref:hydrocephalus-inducing protein-like n=1 Tax=Lathamus discolor TaxID=678569 RepID=UPI0032B841E7